MDRLRKLVGVLVSALFAMLVVPIVGQFFVELAKERGWYAAPSAWVVSVLELITPITGSWWFLVSLGFFGGAAGAYWILDALPRPARAAKSALLEVAIHGPSRNPYSVREKNIARWSWLQAVYQTPRQPRQIPHTFIIVVFDNPVINPRFSVTSQGVVLPPHEVRFGNDRYAFIIIDGALQPGNIIIDVQARQKN
jgi:hypothetical protein